MLKLSQLYVLLSEWILKVFDSSILNQKERSKMTLSHCPQALGLLTEMFYYKMVLYLLRVFFRSFEVFL